ncbi:MAG: glycosyl transferase [Desulfovibrio sp.]|nr:glycosyl transferase [Desulfovibrio sp.]
MKTVFCIDDNPRYLLLLKAAVRSLRALHGDDAPLLCVYGGDDAHVLAEVRAERIPLARYKPLLNKETMPRSTHPVIGCLLRLELALVPELADDPAVLYCDSDTFFLRPLDALFAAPVPAYLGMAREATAPFYNEHEQLGYDFHDRHYTVRLPFPIWTFSSAVTLFNLERLRRRDLVGHLLAFSRANVEAAGNLDQSLLNYFFGKRITRLEDRWNRPPYQADCLDTAHIVHFHGPKPWEVSKPWPGDELRINCFMEMRRRWYDLLSQKERALADSWD